MRTNIMSNNALVTLRMAAHDALQRDDMPLEHKLLFRLALERVDEELNLRVLI